MRYRCSVFWTFHIHGWMTLWLENQQLWGDDYFYTNRNGFLCSTCEKCRMMSGVLSVFISSTIGLGFQRQNERKRCTWSKESGSPITSTVFNMGVSWDSVAARTENFLLSIQWKPKRKKTSETYREVERYCQIFIWILLSHLFLNVLSLCSR